MGSDQGLEKAGSSSAGRAGIAKPVRPGTARLIWAVTSVKLTKGNCPHNGATISSASSWGRAGIAPSRRWLCAPSPAGSGFLRLPEGRPHAWGEGAIQSWLPRDSQS